MNTRIVYSVFAASIIFVLFSCKNTPSKNHGPIILGDSNTIVTEKDPQKLHDMVTELQPVITSSENKDTAITANKPQPTDTAKKNIPATAAAQQPAPETPGLKADFGETSLLLPNVNAKISGNANLLHASGAVYTLVSGNINGNLIRVTGNVTKVSMRYQSVVVVKSDNGTFPVESLSNTTVWTPLKGGNNIYRITGLDGASLEYADDGPAAIKSAVQRAAQRHRISKKKIQELMSSIHNIRAANQKPLTVVLRSVMWKIDGKDAKGRPFSRQVRIDMPM